MRPLTYRLSAIWTLLLLGLVACVNRPAATGPEPAPATVDAAALAQEVLEQVRTELAASATPTGSRPDQAPAATLEALVRREVAESLAATAAAPAPPATEPDPGGYQALESALVDVYALANSAVVTIIAAPVGSGTGFVYDPAGHIVTNNHVVAGASSYEIVFAGGERLRGRLVGRDADSDLAVLQVDALPAGVHPLALGDSDDLEVGQLVVAIGNPFGEQGSMSLGIISGLGRSLPSQRGQTAGTAYALPQVIQTDAPINPGNSGGPLLDLAGKVLGVNSAIVSTTGTNSGVGFAIPVNAVRQVVPGLIADGAYRYPYMGAAFDEEISLDEQGAFDLPQTSGAYVLSVSPGSPAAQAGLRGASATTGRGGDLIVAIDDRPVGDFNDLNSYLVFHTTVGQTIELTVIRNGARLTVPLTLGQRP